MDFWVNPSLELLRKKMLLIFFNMFWGGLHTHFSHTKIYVLEVLNHKVGVHLSLVDGVSFLKWFYTLESHLQCMNVYR